MLQTCAAPSMNRSVSWQSGQYTTPWMWKPEFDSRIGHHVTDVRCALDESWCEVAIFASRASLIIEITLCASRACKRLPCGATSDFYSTATSTIHNLSTPPHATPTEFTHIDHNLVEDPSQKTVVDLGSRTPSLALDTSLAPENPRTK